MFLMSLSTGFSRRITSLEIAKQYSHKSAKELLQGQKPELLREIEESIQKIRAVDCLTKIPKEESKIRKWGLVYSPPTVNAYFRRELLESHGWLEWNKEKKKYVEPALRFTSDNTVRGNDRYRKLDGLKNRVGLEIQFGKYAFMGYDIFSKMIIFKNHDLIDYGIEIVFTQEMIDCMSTGVSAFEHIMIDFKHRGEADIDIPVLVIGVHATKSEWDEVYELQSLFKRDPQTAYFRYPNIGRSDLKGTPPGPK